MAQHETVADWSQGVPLAYVRELCDYWADGYNWRGPATRLNTLPQFQKEIAGIRFVFAHVRSPNPGALPLILTGGWPGGGGWPGRRGRRAGQARPTRRKSQDGSGLRKAPRSASALAEAARAAYP